MRTSVVLVALVALAACGHHDAAPAARPCTALLGTFTQASSRLACTTDADCAAVPGVRVTAPGTMGAPDACPGAVQRDAVAAYLAAAHDLEANACATLVPAAPLACRGHAGAIACTAGRCIATFSY